MKKGSRSFLKRISAFFTRKGLITNENNTLKENGTLKYWRKEIAETFNSLHITSVENETL